MNLGDYVAGGEVGTDGYDVGEVIDILDDGRVEVAWACGDLTVCNPADLRPATCSPMQWLHQGMAAEEQSAEPSYLCHHCGHPVPADGIRIMAADDYDHTDRERARCDDTACVSDAVARYEGDGLVDALG